MDSDKMINKFKLELPSDEELHRAFHSTGDPYPFTMRAVARFAQDSARKQIADALRSMLYGGRRFFREETQSLWMPEGDVCKFLDALDPPASAEKKLDEDTLAVVCDWMRRSMGEDHANRFRARFGPTTCIKCEGGKAIYTNKTAPTVVNPPAKPRMVSVDAVMKLILEERGDVVKWTRDGLAFELNRLITQGPHDA